MPVVLLGLQPTADARLRAHRHRRVAGQLRRLLRPRAGGRLHARADPLRHGGRHHRRRRARVGEDRGLGPRRGRRRVAAPRPDRLPRPHLSGHARHVLRLHRRPRPARRARRGARDRRPRRARGAGRPRPSVAAKEAEIRAMFDFADPSDDPIAGPIEDDQLDWSVRVAVGLDRLVADFELDGLTYYYRGLDGNEAERLGAGVIVGNSLLTARGVPTAGEGDLKTNLAQLVLDRLGAGGSYTEYYALDFDEGFVLMGHDGPGARRHRAGAPGAARAQALPRQARRRPVGRVQGPLRADHDPRRHPDRRRRAEARRRRGRVDPGADVPDRQHELAPALRVAAGRVLRALVRRGARPTTSRWASGIASRSCGASRRCWTCPCAVVG